MKILRLFPSIVILSILLATTTGMRPLAPQTPLGAVINVTIFTNEYNDSSTGCSLREAVQSANNDANFGGCIATGSYGHDTIYLGTGTYLFSRGSGPSISEDANVYGDLDISPSDGGLTLNIYDVTIIGEGSGNTILDATTQDRVIDIQANAYLKLVGVKIYRGHPSPSDAKIGNGAGIYNHGTLRIEDCAIENNWAQNNEITGAPHIGDGGGIWSDGFLSIDNSVFYNNRASMTYNGEDGGDGGGIFIAAGSSTVTITDSTLISNSSGDASTTAAGDGGRGGGIFNAGPNTQLVSSTLELNTAGQAHTTTGHGGDGGGIYNYQGKITITNSTVYNNRAGSSQYATSGSGGGLVNNGGLMELHESTVIANRTESGVSYGSGGGIESSADNTITRLHNTLLAGNSNPGPLEDESIKDCHTGSAVGNVFEARYSLIRDLTGCVLDVSECWRSLRDMISSVIMVAPPRR
jgi:CSLREA domain-containing protein